MKFKQVILIVAISSGSALASVWGYSKFAHKEVVAIQSESKVPANYAGFFDGNAANAPVNIDFTQAASTSVQAVVHIKTKIAAQKVSNELPRGNSRNRGGLDDWLDQFFDFGPQSGIIPEQRASGSGVLISDDGYIVTNNHVVSDQNGGVAGEIMVTLHNKKTYKARLIGKDPSSDIAVLKIDGNSFPYLVYGNSDDVKLGQWVLAIGYPLTLETTVTAGIVSAKGRSIGINERQTRGTNVSPVESFIQTDAAVNQGNSGGALVTTDGKLVGINSAILAPNGTYAGYSFAIPVNIAKKIVNDIVEFGDVQRGYLGIQFSDLNEEQMKQLGIKENEGVYVSAVPTDGGAYAAGIKKGDLITKVNNTPVSTGLEMSAQLAGFRPNDKVQMSYLRGGKEYNTTVTLRAKVSAIETSTAAGDIIGAELANLDPKKAGEYDVSGGVVVKKIKEGGKLSETKMDEGFVITSVNGRVIKSIDELSKTLSSAVGTVKLEGFYPGFRGSYTYPLDLTD